MRSFIRLLRKRGSSGFTLVEMIVSVALLAVLMAGMMIFISPVIRSYNDNQVDNNAQNVTTCVQDYISRNIRNSYKMVIFENTSYTSIKSNSAYTDEIKKMNDFCNASGDPGLTNKSYLLKCLSLRYDDADKRFYLWDEAVDMTANGNIKTADSKKVFADCLFSDIYVQYEFAKPKNGDYVEGGTKPEFRKDALQMTLTAYRDEGYSSMIFQGSGITELRQIKCMLADGKSESDYYANIVDAGSSTEKDIYIFYVTRNYNVT